MRVNFIYTTIASMAAAVFYFCGAAFATNLSPAAETWVTISNRWSSVPLEEVERNAGQTNATAEYYLGRSYLDGIRVRQDPAEGLKWIRQAADEGLPQAEFSLARMYEMGTGVPQDYEEAVRLYRLAANQGHGLAENNLGRCYFKGLGVEQDAGEALKWYQRAADSGEAWGKKSLAWMYAQGAYGKGPVSGQGAEAQVRSGGIAPNHDLAEKLMREAVDLNSAEGQYEFAQMVKGEMNDQGHEDTTRFPLAAEWFRKAAEQNFASAQFELAEMYHDGELGNNERSNCIPWFLKAAAQGNAEAQNRVGELPKYYPDSPLLKPINNITSLREAAEHGNLDAQFQLARRYQFGEGLPQDDTHAFEWMQKAATNDTPSSLVGDAIYQLALMYEKGQGVKADLAEAHRLFLCAATVAQQSEATFRVGQMYENGEGVPQDDHKAAEFYANKYYYFGFPQYTNGYAYYGNPGDGAIKALFKLWSEGRGFPTVQDRTVPGCREVSDLIQSWQGEIRSAEEEFYLGQIYYKGKLLPQNLIEADARLRVAADEHLQLAGEILHDVDSRLQPAEVEAAKERCKTLTKDLIRAQQTHASLEQGKNYKPW